MNGFSPRRVYALVLRYWYLLRSSGPRILDLVYWPTVQMLMWGFLQSYLADQTGNAAMAAGTLIGAVLLWDILFRGQIGFSMTFLEEMWSRNLGNILMTPLRSSEFVAAMMIMSVVRVLIGLVPVTLLAIWLFGFNFWSLGLAVPLFFLLLIMTGWAVGLVACGFVLRYGLGAETLSWSLIFLLLPLTCVYYPVAALPDWLAPVALALPPTHVFEGLRALLLERSLRPDLMASALLLNLVYLGAASGLFAWLLRAARREGSLLQIGE